MGLFILFLTITIKLGLAEISNIYVPDDFLNYHRNDDIHHTEATDHKVGKIKYTEILSLLHNDNINKALLAEIRNPSTLNDSKELRRDNYDYSENDIVKEDTIENNQKFKRNTRPAIKDWNRLRRSNDNSDKATVKDIPKLTTGDSNKLEEVDDKASGKVTVKRDQHFKDIPELPTKYLNGLNKEDNTDKITVKDIPKLTTGDSNKLEGDDDKASGKVAVKRDQDYKNITGLFNKDLKRLNKEDNTDKAIVKDIPKLTTGDLIKLEDHNKASSKVTVKRDQDFKDVTGLPNKDLNGLNNEDNIDKAEVKGDVNNVRSKRHSALKLLRNLVHYTTDSTPRNKSILPLYLQKTHDVTVNSTFTDMIENLTKSIKVLNENMVNLKLHMNDKVGFAIFKVPINEFEEKRYIKSIPKVEEKNEYKPKNYNVRSKRDVDAVSTDKTNKNNTVEEDQTNFNITKNDNSIVDARENVEPTIISDSETVNKLNELNKFKRDSNITNTETNTISSNNTIVNVTGKSNETIKTRRFNIDEPTIKSEGNESNNSKTPTSTQNNSESKTSNTTTNPLDIKVKGKTRKFLGNRDDLLFFIEKTHRDIKTLITPVDGIKEKYSATILYKIGYIIANLDTMELTLKKLKNRIVKNLSDTNRLHQILKKLSMSKKLVRNVMGYLNKYAQNQLL